MSGNDNKQELEKILKKYDETTRNLYSKILKLQQNSTMKSADKKLQMKEYIAGEVQKNVD